MDKEGKINDLGVSSGREADKSWGLSESLKRLAQDQARFFKCLEQPRSCLSRLKHGLRPVGESIKPADHRMVKPLHNLAVKQNVARW